MRVQLPYYEVCEKLGWDQEDFRDPFMYFGGCGAVTACDLSIFLAREHDMTSLCPFSPEQVEKADYLAFSKTMKRFLRPRVQGVDTLELWLEGYQAYLRSVSREERLPRFYAFPQTGNSWEEAAKQIVRQIDRHFLVPMLLLRHKNYLYKDISWHWFNLAGYDSMDDDLLLRLVTYGEEQWISLRELWDSGYEERGGLIGMRMPEFRG